MNNQYKTQCKIKYSQVDYNFLMRLDHIFTYFQDVTGDHSNEMEIDSDTMRRTSNAFWVISRMKIKIHSIPKFEQIVTVETWPTFAKGVRFGRDYTIACDGQPLVSCSSEWCTLDCDTNRPRKVDTVHYPHDMPHRTDRSDAGDFLPMAETIDQTNYHHTHKIRLTDIDANHHANNISYLRMMLDCFDLDELQGENIDQVQINYAMQTYFDDEIAMYKKKTNNGYYVEGICNGQTAFRCLIICK